jgi:glycosyltransferase involved in cell wall biosynthesis
VQWADKIFVVDSFSTDHTLEICKKYTDWIVQHEYIYSSKQKNWAVAQITTDWVLHIDSDEELEPALIEEIQNVLKNNDQPDAYLIPFHHLIWGKWVKHCNMYPGYQPRLFKTKLGRWTDREVHAKQYGFNTFLKLKNHIIHHDMDDVSSELQQFSKQVVVWESNELVKKNKKWTWIDVTLRPLAIFFLYYFHYQGYKEGFRGFYLSVFKSFYGFMTYARLYEHEVYADSNK